MPSACEFMRVVERQEEESRKVQSIVSQILLKFAGPRLGASTVEHDHEIIGEQPDAISHSSIMSLTPEQARQLWDAGGFALIQGLPRGSEVGMDGT